MCVGACEQLTTTDLTSARLTPGLSTWPNSVAGALHRQLGMSPVIRYVVCSLSGSRSWTQTDGLCLMKCGFQCQKQTDRTSKQTKRAAARGAMRSGFGALSSRLLGRLAAVRRLQSQPSGNHAIPVVRNAARSVVGGAGLSNLQTALYADPGKSAPPAVRFPAWVVPGLKLVSLLMTFWSLSDLTLVHSATLLNSQCLPPAVGFALVS